MPAPNTTSAPPSASQPSKALLVICAWCQVTIRPPASAEYAAPACEVSHGICASCAKAIEERSEDILN